MISLGVLKSPAQLLKVVRLPSTTYFVLPSFCEAYSFQSRILSNSVTHIAPPESSNPSHCLLSAMASKSAHLQYADVGSRASLHVPLLPKLIH